MSFLKAGHRVHDDRPTQAPHKWKNREDILKQAAWFTGGSSKSMEVVASPKILSLPPPANSNDCACPIGAGTASWNLERGRMSRKYRQRQALLEEFTV
jgi:hypothetical protein